MSEHVLNRALEHALAFLRSAGDRPVGAKATWAQLLASLGGPVPEQGEDPVAALDAMVRAADPGMVASAGPRYFGFVVGGSLPAALAADWMTSAWDQNAALNVLSPGSAALEEIAGGWVLDLLGLPKSASIGFVTGGQTANFTCILAARHKVLRDAGWDVEDRGLSGAPRVRVVAGAQVHVSVKASLRMAGFGAGGLELVPADSEGRMIASELRKVLAQGPRGPCIVLAQAGEVNSGAFDPLAEIEPVAHEHGAWLHVDGAFGLWAAAAPSLRHLLAGFEKADSWSTDGHKWLNVPYDCGIAMTAHPAAHQAAMAAGAAYLVVSQTSRNPYEWVPEGSRRGRATPVYLTLRTLGRRGLADLIERSCGHARRMAKALAAGGAQIVNEVVLNQVLVRFGDRTDEVIARVQAGGVCWLAGTRWQGSPAMRISVSGWNTTEADVDRSAEAILQAAR